MVSPEQEIKDQIRVMYAKTYPNIIFTLTNTLERQRLEIEELKTKLENRNKGAT